MYNTTGPLPAFEDRLAVILKDTLHDLLETPLQMLYSRDTTLSIHIYAETLLRIMTNEHASLEKYTSHTLFERVAKELCVRGELEIEQTATY